jgi:hypothetical protein
MLGSFHLPTVVALAVAAQGCIVTADSTLWQRGDGRVDAPVQYDATVRELPAGREAGGDRRLELRATEVRPADLRPADLRPIDSKPPDHTLQLLTIELEAVEDASVKDGSPTTAFGGSDELAMGYCSGTTNGNMRSWLKFDFASLPSGATIQQAELRLFFLIHWGSQDYPVHRSTTDSWSEATITWDTQPSIDPTPLFTCPAFYVDNVWRSWDVTTAAQQELAGDKKLSLLIKGATHYPAGSATDYENYAYSRQCTDPALRPKLHLEVLAP